MTLFDRLRSFFSAEYSLKPLEKIIGYKFSNRDYLYQAFTHKSVSSEPRKNYERLEFLGDAVIDIIVSRELMREFSVGDEGILTQKRSALVQKSFLASMGNLLNLLDFIIIEPTVDLKQSKIATRQSANLYEALIGAIFLDSGILPTKILILNTVWKHRHQAWKSINYKGNLIELCHSLQVDNPKFLVSHISGPDHQKLFEIQVKIGKKVYPSGVGTDKKSAEQQAAQFAIDSLTS